jgi:hypothetical protein
MSMEVDIAEGPKVAAFDAAMDTKMLGDISKDMQEQKATKSDDAI